MHRLAALLPLLLVAAAEPPPPPPAPVTASLAPDAEQRWVPFALTPANQIRFTATLGGQPVNAILDTGVSASAISTRFARAAKLDIMPGVRATAVGGVVGSGWVRAPALGFGGLTVHAMRLAVVTLPGNATGGDAIDLLVGRDLLAPYALDIDYDQARFRLLPSGRMPFAGATAPLRIGGGAPVYLSEIAIDGRRFARMIVDTGDGNAVTLSSDAWRGVKPPGAMTTTLSYGIGGTVVTGLTILPSLTLGALRSRTVDVTIEDSAFARATGSSGRIGTGFLQRYRVLLDPTAGHMVLAPGSRADAAPQRSTSGLIVTRAHDRLRVIHVMQGSPAAADDWHVGDMICGVDGTTIGGAGESLDWPIGAPGRSVALLRCDGTQRALTLRQFY